jgi:glycosyltransferase involved in cell wall biosynthesis
LVGEDPPARDQLAYYPSSRWNAYMRLLYARCPEFGFEPHPLESVDAIRSLPPTGLVHLHWTRAAQLGAETEAEAREASARFLEPVEGFVSRGGTLLWSIHEVLAHDAPFPGVEAGLRARIADLSHGIHVHHPSMVEMVQGHFTIDESKVTVIEHPLYTGVYEDFVRRTAARRAMGLPDDAVLLLGFGGIRSFKGFDRLVRLLPTVRERSGRDVRVMIAGRTLASEDHSDLLALVGSTEGASIITDGPADESVQYLFRAADFVVLPYREFYTSGVLFLGLTFLVPMIVPRVPVTEELRGSGLVRLFEMASDEDLAAALIAAVGDDGARPVQLPADILERHDLHRIAGSFAEWAREIKEQHLG